MKFTLPWGHNQSKHAVERSKARARLLASNVVSSMHAAATARSDEDHRVARARIAQKLKLGSSDPHSIADDVLQVIIRHLQASELTINFRAAQFFRKPVKGRTYGNCFELAMGTGAAQLKDRDAAENALFAYAAPTVPSDPRYGAKSGQKVASAIAKHGVAGLDAKQAVTNRDFYPGMRPKYAAVNFQRDSRGAAFKYGDDNFVLKSYVKHNATYTHFDSYKYRGQDPKAPNELATYHNMAPIVRYMEDGMLDVLLKEASGIKAGPIGYASYIEAQLHGDVDFGRDVDRIVIPNGVASVPSPARGHLEAFARQFNLRIASA